MVKNDTFSPLCREYWPIYTVVPMKSAPMVPTVNQWYG